MDRYSGYLKLITNATKEVFPVSDELAPFIPLMIILGAFFIASYMIVIFYAKYMSRQRKRSSLGSALLLLGPCNTGKTALFYRLKADKFPDTVTTLDPHDVLMDINREALPTCSETSLKKRMRVVDFPGHPRLRWKLPEFIKDARAIVFVIDPSCVAPAKNAKETAEYLYDVFVECIKAKRKPRMIIACNKSDISNSSPENIRQTLAQHLDVLKTTRHSLSAEGETEGVLLGVESLPFSFENDSGLDVDFASISIKQKSLDPLSEFISKSF